MADNLGYTPGSGATVSTEEITNLNGGAVSAQHAQRVIQAVRTADGTAVDVSSSEPLPVNIVDASGVVQTQVNNSLDVHGDVQHDSPDAIQGPVKIGGHANAAAPTNVAENDRVNGWFLLNGTQVVSLQSAGDLIGGDATNGLDVDVTRLPALAAGTNNIGDVDVLTVPAPHASIGTALAIGLATSSTQTSANLIAGTGGQRIYVTNLTIATAGTTSGRVSIYYGTGAFTAGTSVTVFDGEFKPSSTRESGVVLTFPIPIGGASATGDNLRITTSAAMTIYVTGQCYKA